MHQVLGLQGIISLLVCPIKFRNTLISMPIYKKQSGICSLGKQQ